MMKYTIIETYNYIYSYYYYHTVNNILSGFFVYPRISLQERRLTWVYLFGFFIYIYFVGRTNLRRSTGVPLHGRVPSASRGWVEEGCGGLDFTSGVEGKCIGRNSWPKCDRCACAAAADGLTDFHGDILLLLLLLLL